MTVAKAFKAQFGNHRYFKNLIRTDGFDIGTVFRIGYESYGYVYMYPVTVKNKGPRAMLGKSEGQWPESNPEVWEPVEDPRPPMKKLLNKFGINK